MKRAALFILLCLTVLLSAAQSYQWRASIDSVPADGFYRIALNPSVSTHLHPGFYDLRILSGNKEVPYILQKEEPAKRTVLFKEYEITSKELHAGAISYITLRNSAKNSIDNIQLVVRNSDVAKSIKLTGSDEQIEWFTIKDNYDFYSVFSTKETSEITILNFPLSNYEYYRLEINDKKSKPINIIKAGYYDYNSEKGKYTVLPPPLISQADS